MFTQFPSIPALYLSDMNKAAGKVPVPRGIASPLAPSDPSKPSKKATDVDSVMVRAPVTDVVQAWHQAFVISPKTIRVLRALPLDQQPTSTDANIKICLSYHLKGFCYTKCMNCSTHRSLDATETTTFQAFVSSKF